jgi:hypothetical protein
MHQATALARYHIVDDGGTGVRVPSDLNQGLDENLHRFRTASEDAGFLHPTFVSGSNTRWSHAFSSNATGPISRTVNVVHICIYEDVHLIREFKDEGHSPSE